MKYELMSAKPGAYRARISHAAGIIFIYTAGGGRGFYVDFWRRRDGRLIERSCDGLLEAQSIAVEWLSGT